VSTLSRSARHGELGEVLLAASRGCIRPPVGRFRHPWLAPMPPREPARAGKWDDDHRFVIGDYAGALFHHDVSESAIENCRDPELAEASFGSLLCFLDCATPDGCIHRIELPHRVRDPEPAKPVMAQLALRATGGVDDGLARADRHGVLPRLVAFVEYLERTSTGLHGLLLTPSARASGFDSDVLTAGLPELSVEGPDTNTFMVLEYRALAELAERLAQPGIAVTMRARADALVQRIDELLWHEPARSYVALRWRHGAGAMQDEIVGYRDADGVARPLASWISLLPLLAGIPAVPRADALFEALLDPEGYWGPAGVRTVPRRDLLFQQAPRIMIFDPRKGERGPVSNWSGPVWVLASFYMFRALRGYGRAAEARELALRTADVLADDLRQTGMLHECYADDGRGLWPQRGTFISWNVLAMTMLRESAEVESDSQGASDA
jgi:putative isomerase